MGAAPVLLIERQTKPTLGFDNTSEGWPTLLFVDDERAIHAGIRRILAALRFRCNLRFAISVDDAIARINENCPDVVLSDVAMPGKDGFALLRAVRNTAQLRHLPIVMITGSHDQSLKRKALELGAVDLITKPLQAEDLIARVNSVLKIARYENQLRANAVFLEQRVRDRTLALEQSRREIIFALAAAGEFRDLGTGRHVRRVAAVSKVVADRLGLPAQLADHISVASTLHDIGKIGVPDGILRKPGPLTPEERAMMERHCEIGYDILRGEVSGFAIGEKIFEVAAGANSLMELAREIALCHHERWDGGGYPRHLPGERIPLGARIVAIADVFDALRCKRPYKPAIPQQRVLEILRSESGKHFDPAVVNALESAWNEVEEMLLPFWDSAVEA